MEPKIETQYLSDGSEAYNVCLPTDGVFIRFACADQKNAQQLAEQLEDVVWVETN